MYKNKIARKLSLYFAAALLIFSIIIGAVFMFLFSHHNLVLQRNEIATRAEAIATTLAELIETGSGMRGMGGFGPYLHFIGDIAGTDVWIVDRDFNVVTSGTWQDMINGSYTYSDLPENADNLIQEVFQNQTAFSEDFSGVLSESTVTVGTPIEVNGNVVGAVLLHSPVSGISKAVFNGFTLLAISILAALAIAFIISVKFSVTFTKPLNKMKDTALLLADGNYTAKNEIKQNDEIGQLAETLDILADRLDLASKESERLEQMRREFVANISHELKTPITVVRGSLEALVEKVVTDPVQIESYHQQMLSETVFLQRLVGDLLDLSRLQNMDFVIEKQDVFIHDVIDDVIRSVSQIADKKGMKMTVNKDSVNYTVYADYGRLRQMLIIVLENAIKFSPDGGTVEVALKNRTLSIHDYGTGISENDLPYIFDRFYKSRSEQNKTGTGLGLAIAKQIADRHNIKLTANSTESKGAEFIFEL